jgi:hypothetical protein
MSIRLKANTKAQSSPKPSFTGLRSGRLQRSFTNHAGPATVPPIVHEVLRSPGQPLDVATRAHMEPRFGHDFSRVRVHTDAKAAESARAVNSLAYTVGRDVVFGVGQYAPERAQGKKILAHELAHTVQQGHRSSLPRQLEIGPIDGEHEGTADQVGLHILNGTISKVNRYLYHETRLHGTIQRSCIFPWRPGRVQFNDCTSGQLNDYAVIPETGRALIMPPINGVWYDSDGFWQRHHRPRSEWYKVRDHCDLSVTCRGTSFDRSVCCNPPVYLPGWESTPHGTTNPF